jgi:hypothetical protein
MPFGVYLLVTTELWFGAVTTNRKERRKRHGSKEENEEPCESQVNDQVKGRSCAYHPGHTALRTGRTAHQGTVRQGVRSQGSDHEPFFGSPRVVMLRLVASSLEIWHLVERSRGFATWDSGRIRSNSLLFDPPFNKAFDERVCFGGTHGLFENLLDQDGADFIFQFCGELSSAREVS